MPTLSTVHVTKKDEIVHKKNKYLRYCYCLPASPFCQGLLIAFLCAGLILTTITALWLTSSKSTTTTTTTTTSTSVTTSTTATTTTSTSTSTATSTTTTSTSTSATTSTTTTSTSTSATTTTTTTTTTTLTCLASGSTTQSPGGQGGASVLYTFDNTANDYFGNYNAVPVNNPTYVSLGYNGRGSAIQLRQNLSQYLTIANYMNFYHQSLTVEAWIYPFTIYTGNPYVDTIIYTQTNSSSLGQYMRMMLRNASIYGAFYNDDVRGPTLFQANQWQHMAFTYDYATLTQTVYRNGIVDAVHTNAAPCQITSGYQTIGSYEQGSGGFFDGYIDQLTILFNQAKTAAQILADATLVAYYSMDCLSYTSWDSGPNLINGLTYGLDSGDGGRVGQSYLFNSSLSYFQTTGLVLLGQSYSPFSFAMWLRPLVITSGTILHVSVNILGTDWCVKFIGFSSLGNIIVGAHNASGPVQVIGPIVTIGEWVHIVETYCQTNGVRLYVNGILYGQSSAFVYAASGVPMTVTLGQDLNGSYCEAGGINGGQYYGEIDEFYIFSRELSQADITALANP